MSRLVLLLALLAATADRAAAQRSLVIERFDAVIRVEPDGTIDVTETITARFTGAWNGIYRSIPVKYRTAQGLNWTLGLDVLGATDADGQALRLESGREGHYVKLRMWIPGAENATRTAVLHYRATNALRFFDEHDELYWNVTGDEWEVPIEAATARIELPPNATGLRAIAFNGVYGSTAQDASVEIEGTAVRIAMPHALSFYEGLTAVVGWDKGIVSEPTAAARAAGVLGSNWPLLIPVPVLLGAFLIWRRRGRDPRPLPVTVRYEPPAGLTPGEAGTLLDNRPDMRDITATLVDLAVRGHLRFEERDESKLFGLIKDREYVLHRLEPPADAGPVAPHEQRLLDGIFPGRGSAVALSDLEDEFYSTLPGIHTAIFDRLLERGLYRARPDRVRQRWQVAGILLGILIVAVGTALSAKLLLTPVPFFIAGVLTAVILLVFGAVMPARSVAGARALEAVLGFEEFLRRVDGEQYRRVIVGHPELFDRYLPFAMAFGVEKKWARAFENIYTQTPTWYTGPAVTHFSVGRLSNSLAGFSARAGTAMTSSPRSSSGSGFGGGGSSGGGGGGGGGGGF
jgi:uncharacterized protein (TIGR04222 family)